MAENDNQDRVLIVGPAGKMNILKRQLGEYIRRGYEVCEVKATPKAKKEEPKKSYKSDKEG